MNKTNIHENWIVIVNAHHAKIFSKVFKLAGKNNASFDLLTELEAELDTNHEKPDRSFESVGTARHGVVPHTDRRDVEKQQFAKKVYEYLKIAENKNQFEDLILVASPRMMEMMKECCERMNSMMKMGMPVMMMCGGMMMMA